MSETRQRMATVRSWMKEVLTGDTAETVIRLAVVLSITLGIVSSFITIRLQTCSQQYQEANAMALQARDVASSQDRSAMDDLVTSISSAKTANETRAALQAYLDTRAKSDSLRARNPLPIPKAFC